MHNNPSECHWKSVKQILHYLKGSAQFDISVHHAYVGVDWASIRNNCKSTTGFAISFGGNLATWSFKKAETHFSLAQKLGILCGVTNKTNFAWQTPSKIGI